MKTYSVAELAAITVHRAPVIRTGERQPISPLVRQLVYRRDNWQCQRCGAYPSAPIAKRRSGPLHLDHIIPWSAGGSDRSDNLRTLCEPCNLERSNWVTSVDEPAMPIVRVCVPCVVLPRLWSLPDVTPGDELTVYCGSCSHVSWTFPGAHVL
jgi:hypothetical protein